MGGEGDLVWFEPVEGAPLSADEETDTQTPVSAEGDMTWTGRGVNVPYDIRRRGRGRTIKGGNRGVSEDSPLTSKIEILHGRMSTNPSRILASELPKYRLPGLTFNCPQIRLFQDTVGPASDAIFRLEGTIS